MYSPQIIVNSTLKVTRAGGEALVFDIDLGLFRLSVTAVIPDEGLSEAPVYVHFRIRTSSRTNGKGRRTRPSRDEATDDMELDRDRS